MKTDHFKIDYYNIRCCPKSKVINSGILHNLWFCHLVLCGFDTLIQFSKVACMSIVSHFERRVFQKVYNCQFFRFFFDISFSNRYVCPNSVTPNWYVSHILQYQTVVIWYLEEPVNVWWMQERKKRIITYGELILI